MSERSESLANLVFVFFFLVNHTGGFPCGYYHRVFEIPNFEIAPLVQDALGFSIVRMYDIINHYSRKLSSLGHGI